MKGTLNKIKELSSSEISSSSTSSSKVCFLNFSRCLDSALEIYLDFDLFSLGFEFVHVVVEVVEVLGVFDCKAGTLKDL